MKVDRFFSITRRPVHVVGVHIGQIECVQKIDGIQFASDYVAHLCYYFINSDVIQEISVIQFCLSGLAPLMGSLTRMSSCKLPSAYVHCSYALTLSIM